LEELDEFFLRRATWADSFSGPGRQLGDPLLQLGDARLLPRDDLLLSPDGLFLAADGLGLLADCLGLLPDDLPRVRFHSRTRGSVRVALQWFSDDRQAHVQFCFPEFLT
jgi:hypothetical protein